MITHRLVALLMAVVLAVPTVAGAQNIPQPPPGTPPAPPPQVEQGAVAPTQVDPAVTPVRLSYLYGAVSFRRPGADNWTPAALNTPLAPGDAIYTGQAGNVEIQVGPQAFIRAAQETQLGLDNQEADFVQVRVPLGHVAIDVGQLPQGSAIEVDTPNGAFTIEQPGYYRVDVTSEWAALAVHRGGRASVTTASGGDTLVAAGQQAVVSGSDAPRIDLRPAQALDGWDQWNQTRTVQLKQGESARYVAGSVYGTETLDQHGSWQTDESYGRVWLPASVPAGWVPYSTGRWIWDSRFGWTWLDEAPWGWAPYHYGRWVFVRSRWAWAPGPIVVRPVYAPALVVFLGGRTVGRPLCWAPLGWGEPVIPWWGRPGFVGVVTWAGWGGPRVVNNVVVNRTTVNVTNITVYRNVQVTNAVVGVPAERFGRGDSRPVRVAAVDVQQLRPVHGAPKVQPVAASVAPRRERGIAPPEASHRREVVGTRKPHDPTPAVRAAGLPAPATDAPPRSTRVVAPPAQRGGPARDAAPTVRERDGRAPDASREQQRGRPVDVNREPPPQRPPDANREQQRGRPVDVNREPPPQRPPDANREQQRGRPVDVNREPPPQRPPDANREQQRGRPVDVNREPPPQRPPDANREQQRGRPVDVNREPPPQRPPDANREQQRGRPVDVNREPPPQRPPDANREQQRGRPVDVNREQPPQQRPPDANREQPRGRPADVNREPPPQRPPDVNREQQRGRQVDVNREQPQQRPPDTNREQRGRPADVNRGQPQRPADVNREPPQRQPDVSREQRQRQPDAERGGDRGNVQRPDAQRRGDTQRRDGDAQPRGGTGERRDDAQRQDVDGDRGTPSRPAPDATREQRQRQRDGISEPRGPQRDQGVPPPAPRSGQPGGRPQQGDGSDDGKNPRPTPRPGPSSQAPAPTARGAVRATEPPVPVTGQATSPPTTVPRRASQHPVSPAARDAGPESEVRRP